MAELTQIASELGNAARAVGTEGFYEALLQVYGQLAQHSIVTVVRYNRFSKPNFLFHRNFSDGLVQAYLDGFYEFDPFYHYWLEHEQPGIIALHDFPLNERKRNQYASEILRRSRIRDEIAMFLPPIARSSVAIVLERTDDWFDEGEVERVRSLYPALSGLHHAHANCTFASLGSSEVGLGIANMPTAIFDQSGDLVFSNESWQQVDVQDPEIRRAMAALDRAGKSEIAITGGRMLHRTALADDFCLAPGGWLYRLESVDDPPTVNSPREVFERAHPELSPRELDIVELILHGHSTKSVAERLCLSAGTVKNYRRRIYDKLEISTERELFLAHIETIFDTSRTET